MKIICQDCNERMSHTRSGVYVLELKEDGTPYQLWSTDRYYCETCHHSIYAGFGQEPIIQEWEEGFLQRLYDVRRRQSGIATFK